MNHEEMSIFFAEISNISKLFMSDDFLYTERVDFHFFQVIDRKFQMIYKNNLIELVARRMYNIMKYIFCCSPKHIKLANSSLLSLQHARYLLVKKHNKSKFKSSDKHMLMNLFRSIS